MKNWYNKIENFMNTTETKNIEPALQKYRRRLNRRTFLAILGVLMLIEVVMVWLRFLIDPPYWTYIDISVISLGVVAVTIILRYWHRKRSSCCNSTNN